MSTAIAIRLALSLLHIDAHTHTQIHRHSYIWCSLLLAIMRCGAYVRLGWRTTSAECSVSQTPITFRIRRPRNKTICVICRPRRAYTPSLARVRTLPCHTYNTLYVRPARFQAKRLIRWRIECTECLHCRTVSLCVCVCILSVYFTLVFRAIAVSWRAVTKAGAAAVTHKYIHCCTWSV